MERRLALTDFQKIIVYLAVVAAVFLAAMALGQWSLLLLFTGIGVLVVVVLSAYAIQARRRTSVRELATAQVLSVSPVPAHAGIAAPCTMKLAVQVPGRGRVETKVRVTGLAIDRWPLRGQTFPVEYAGGNPHRRLRIRWDLVDAGMVRAPDPARRPRPAPATAPAGTASGFVPGDDGPIWENEEPPVLISPTPPRPRRPTTYASASRTAPEPPPPPAPHLYEEFTDVEEFPDSAFTEAEFTDAAFPGAGVTEAGFADVGEQTVRARPVEDDAEGGQRRLPLPMPPVADPVTNGHDPDGVDLADFESPHLVEEPGPAEEPGLGDEPRLRDHPRRPAEPRLERVVLPDFDPAEIDRSDFFDDFDGSTGRSDDVHDVPIDRSDLYEDFDDGPTERSAGEEPGPPIPQPRDPADPSRGGTGLDASLGVTDLARSLRFYRDALGFEVAHSSPTSAVVEFGGTRILLQSGGDPAEGVATVHVEVDDIEATCAQMRARGIEIVLPPVATGGGGHAQLWRARLRDPDGHHVELVEWRPHDPTHR